MKPKDNKYTLKLK